MVDPAVRVAHEAGFASVFVVPGAWMGPVPGANVIVNDDWESGLGSSLARGLQQMALHTEPEILRAFITLVDFPGLTPQAYQRLARADTDVAAAAYQGRRGNPVLVSRSRWAEVCVLSSGDQGAKPFLESEPDLHLIEVGDISDGRDLDTPV